MDITDMITKENFIGESSALSFEKTVDRLEEVVRLLEKGDVPLDESMALFREGAMLIGACEEMLDEAEQMVSYLDRNGDDAQLEMFFDDDDEYDDA